MVFNLFGLTIGKDEKEDPTIIYDKTPDGATEVVDYGGVYFDGYQDILNSIKDEKELIIVYRSLTCVPEVDQAIIEIVNDSVVYSKSEVYPVKLNLDGLELSENIKNKIIESFEEILRKLKFERKADDLFRSWYVDGRLPLYIDVDKNQVSKGIHKIVYVDPLQIRKVREIKKVLDDDRVEKIVDVQEYFIYSPDINMPTEFSNMNIDQYNVGGVNSRGIKITKDSIVYATSEQMDPDRKFIISHLHKAIKPANQLEQIEDSTVIYRLSRAPERRVFYVDVGNLPKNKAEAYLASLMNRFRNKLSYNSTTGKVKNQTHQKSILEDFWLPRREGGKGTEITTLGGGDGFAGVTEETRYFKEKLYKALNVPVGRIDTDSTFVFGNSGEISRDEIKFSKIIDNLRNTFAHGVFDQLLMTQVVLKKIMSKQEFSEIADSLFYQWEEDSHFAEMKELEVTQKRMEVLALLNDFTTPYFSKAWVRKHVLFQTEDEIEELKKQREEEEKTEPDPIEDDDGSASPFDKPAPDKPPAKAPKKDINKDKEEEDDNTDKDTKGETK